MLRICKLFALISLSVICPPAFAVDATSFTTPYKNPPVLQRMDGGFWRTDGTFRPVLHITNYLVNQTLIVTPVLYMADGSEYDLAPVTLPAAETTEVDIVDALDKMPGSLRSHLSDFGTASVKYVWHWSNAVKAIVQNLDVPRSLNYNFLLRTPMRMSSTGMPARLVVNEGMWWKEDDGVKGFLGISNISDHRLTIRVQIFGTGVAAALNAQDIILPAHNTALMQLDLSLAKMGGVRVAYNGDAHDVVLSGGLENAAEGYSAQIPFVLVDQTAKETNIGVGSAGLMNGPPDPMMMFPQGTQFHIYVAMRNLSAHKVPVIPTVYYMAAGDIKTVTLPALLLRPGQTGFWNGDDLLHNANVAGAGSLNLVFNYHARPSDILIATGSVDQSKTYVFEVEPQALGVGSSRLLGGWNVADGNDTMISLLNPAHRAHNLTITLYYAGGKYILPIHLAAGESKMFNVSEVLMLSRRSGPSQDAVPSGITQGSAQMFGEYEGEQSMGVVVSIAVFNVRNATCGTWCPTCLGYTGDVHISGVVAAVTVGQTATFADFALTQNNAWHDITYGSDWGPTAWSVTSGNVTKSGQGTFLAQGVGGFSLSASTQVNDYPSDCPQGQHVHCPSVILFPVGSGAVVSIQVTSANLWNNAVNVTLQGPSSGNLKITLNGSQQHTSFQYGSGPVAAGSYSVQMTRPNIPADDYASITAEWDVNGSQPTSSPFPITWRVFGVIRHSTYNTPLESKCANVPNQAWILVVSSCNFTPITLYHDFIYYTYLNGTGQSIAHGYLAYSKGTNNQCTYPQGASDYNSFVQVGSVMGSCGQSLDDASVATYPNPKTDIVTFGCRDNLPLLKSSNQQQALKYPEDYCPSCNTGFNGTQGHIDDYTPYSQACDSHSIIDYGNFWTADTYAQQ